MAHMEKLTSQNKKVLLSLTALAIIIAGVWFSGDYYHVSCGLESGRARMAPAYADVKFNPLLFYPAVKENPAPPPSHSSGRALIAPHHDLASRLVARAMAGISSSEIKTIIIIGPNHANAGLGEVITAPITWRTDLGAVEPDQELIYALKQENLAVFDRERLSGEHSITALIPLVKYYFPKARVAPIILNHDVQKEISDKLAVFINHHLDGAALVIGSLDFSHYLPSFQAEKNDEITKKAILEFDYEKIFSFNDDFVDSPITLATILKAAALAKLGRPEFVGHGNSAEMINADNVLSSTSYFTILFNQD